MSGEPRANGPEIERLIEERKRTKPQVSYKVISDGTRNLGPGLDYASPRVLFDARQSERVTATRLHAIAKFLGVPPKQIIKEDEEDEEGTKQAITIVPDRGSSLVVNFNLTKEHLATESMQSLMSVSRKTTQYFIDSALNLISRANNTVPINEQTRDILVRIAEGRLAQLDDISASPAFANTRNPDRERRYENNTRMIVEKAVQYFNSKDIPSRPPDQTFLDFFAESCKKISDFNAQEFFAQILAAKIQRPNELSLRTIRMMQDIDNNTANNFVKFCSIIFKTDDDYVSIRLNNTDEYLGWAGITYDNLLRLVEFGLVVLGLRTFRADVGTRFEYFGRSFQMTQKIEFRANLLSAAGRELFALADPIASPSYFREVLKMLGPDSAGPIQGPSFGQSPK